MLSCLLYENKPIQYAEIFPEKKNDILITFAQNIHCGYTLEPPGEAVLTSTHIICFGSKIRKLGIPLQTPIFLCKGGVYGGIHLHGHVFLMFPHAVCIGTLNLVLPIPGLSILTMECF